jgi:hypothetical protein
VNITLNRGGLIGAVCCAVIGAVVGWVLIPKEWVGKSEEAGPPAFGLVAGLMIGAWVGNYLWTHFSGKP